MTVILCIYLAWLSASYKWDNYRCASAEWKKDWRWEYYCDADEEKRKLNEK